MNLCPPCYIFLLFVLQSAISFGQLKLDANTESLLEKINSAKTKKEIVDEVSKLQKYMMTKKATESDKIYDKILKDNKLKSDYARCQVYFKWSGVKDMLGNHLAKRDVLFEGQKIAKRIKDTSSIISNYSSLSGSYIALGKLDSALIYLKEMERLTNFKHFKDEKWKVYFEYTYLYEQMERWEEEEKAADLIWENIKNNATYANQRLFVLYYNAQLFSRRENWVKFSIYLERIIQIKKNKNRLKGTNHIDLSSLFETQNKEETKAVLKRNIKIADSLELFRNYVYSAFYLSDIYKKENKYSESLELLLKVEEKLKKGNDIDYEIEYFNRLAEVYHELGNDAKAYEFIEKHHHFKDSIFQNDMKLKIAEMEIQYESVEQEKEIASQKLDISEKSRQRTALLGGMGILSLGIIFVLLFFRNKLKYQKTISHQKDHIKDQEINELRNQNKLLAMSSMLEGQEAERSRIAKDLHDGLGSLLSNVKAHFSVIQAEIEKMENMNLYNKANDMIDEACVEVRRIAHNMVPQAIANSGIVGALNDLGANLKQQGYQCIFEFKDIPEDFPEQRSIMLFRIIQELIQNITKHAEAKEIFLQVIRLENQLSVVVEDDGKGFDYNAAKRKDNLGLKSIESRISFLNGQVLFDSAIGKGTTVKIEIPCYDE